MLKIFSLITCCFCLLLTNNASFASKAPGGNKQEPQKLKAQPPEHNQEQDENALLLEKFKSYLHRLNSVAIEFTQTDTQGASTKGMLLIEKPYKFRCNYYPPFPLVIIGNKNYVSVYDYEMEQTSRIKSSENIFNFLLVNDDNLSKYFKLESINDAADKLIVTLKHIQSDKISTVTFDKSEERIEQMDIIEDDNVITLQFEKPQFVQNFDKDLFEMKNPELFGAPSRYSKNQLMQKYRQDK